MSSKVRFVSVLLVAALMVIAGSVMLMQKANAQQPIVTLDSKQDNGATVHLGTIDAYGIPGLLLPNIAGAGPGNTIITYHPAPGYYFVRWETTGGCSVTNVNSNPTTLTIETSGSATAIYSKTGTGVGGVTMPTNTLLVLAPYLALIGLVATAAVVVKRRLEA